MDIVDDVDNLQQNYVARFAGFVVLLLITHSLRCGLLYDRQLRWLGFSSI